MVQKTVTTFPRFIYLNAYAFLLVFMGTGIALVPLYRISPWLAVLQAIPALACLANGLKVFRSWKDKGRKYRILMERNSETFRPDSFTEYMQAPCGRLLVRIVLKDLGKSDMYCSLLKLRKPVMDNLRTSCTPQKTTVYIDGKKV